MRKQFFYALLAIVAIAISACQKKEYPVNMQGNWESYNIAGEDTTISVLSVSNSSATKGIPATIKFRSAYLQMDSKVWIDYEPKEGTGVFDTGSTTGSGLRGDFQAIDKEHISLTLISVDPDGETTYVQRNTVYTLKNSK